MNAPKTAQKKRGPKRTRAAASPLAARVGRTLEKLRADQPLKDLASELGMSHQALSLIESGQTSPDSPKANSTFVTLAKYFQHDLGLPRLRPYVSLNEQEREAVWRLARESGQSMMAQIFSLARESLENREMIDRESAA